MEIQTSAASLKKTGAILFLGFILTGDAEDVIAGRWQGAVGIPGLDMRLVVDLSTNSLHQWIGSLIIPGFHVKGSVVTNITVRPPEVRFTAPEALGGITFQGRLPAAGRMTGQFEQGGNTAPFELTRVGPAQVELPERSSRVDRDLEGEWKGDYELGGYARHVTLILTNAAPDAAHAELTIVGKRENHVPVDLVLQEGAMLRLRSRLFQIQIEEFYHPEARELRGTFSQGPYEAPLLLRQSPK
jgi:hypothetical protein